MKKSLEWHQNCLNNRIKMVNRKKQQLKTLQSEIKRDEKEIMFYSQQINTAFLKRKDSFDRDKFLKPRRGGKQCHR